MTPSPVSDAGPPVSPKDTFVTVYGRKPVLEALRDPALAVDKVILAEGADREAVRTFTEAARARGLVLQRATAQRVKVLAGNGRQDQGVLADVVAPRMRPVEHFLADLDPAAPARVLVLDGLTNPANVGMILRSATGAGLEGVLVPRRGVPAIDPLVIKASAGVAFHAPVLRSRTAATGLRGPGRGGLRPVRAGRSRTRVPVRGRAPRAGRPGRRGRDRRAHRRRARRAARDPDDPPRRGRRVAQRRLCGHGGLLRARAPTDLTEPPPSPAGRP